MAVCNKAAERTLSEHQITILFAVDGDYAKLVSVLGTLYQLPQFIERPLDRRHKAKQLAGVWSLDDAQNFFSIFNLRMQEPKRKVLPIYQRFKLIKNHLTWTPFLLRTAFPLYLRIISLLESCLGIKTVKIREPDYIDILESCFISDTKASIYEPKINDEEFFGKRVSVASC